MMWRSLLFNIAFWGWIAIVGLVGLIPSLLYRRCAFTVGKLWGKGSLWLLKTLCNINYEVMGKEHIPSGACIIASKHQSAWDTIIFWTLLDRPAYVLKKELIFLPVFGWYLLLLRNIYIDRSAGASAIKRILREATLRKNEHRPIIIFPEGTRTLPETTSTYHPGVAALYQHLDIPVIPVALNSGYLWKKNAFTKQAGKITIEFLPPIVAGLKNRDFMATLQSQIEDCCVKLKPAA